jgi:hypothetical protein
MGESMKRLSEEELVNLYIKNFSYKGLRDVLLGIQEAIIAANSNDPIPFDWDKWQTGNYVCKTRDGRDVTQLVKFDTEEDIDTIYGVIDGFVESWDGCGFHLSREENEEDILLHPKKHTVKMQRWSGPLGGKCALPIGVRRFDDDFPIGDPFDLEWPE